MITLGIDFGLKKVGLALGYGSLAEPYQVIRELDTSKLVEQIKQIVEKERVEKIVVGISDGEIAIKARQFGLVLKENLEIPVEFFDETLTTQDAQRLAIEAGIKRSKRKNMEDAYAAAVMLQGYTDQLKNEFN